jgi:3-hydroxyacyl-CoA dehydrogenase/enoyl-CoA hydratase/3-hydroxybutyryl-CoA epimerase
MKGFRIPGGACWMRAWPRLVVGNTLLQAKTFHNMPAPLCIQSCIYEGCQLPIDKGLRIESKYMATLSRSPVARGMIRTLFVNKAKAEKGMHRPAGFEPFQCRKLGLIGAGMMARALPGGRPARYSGVLIDRDQAAADKGKQYWRRCWPSR